MLFPSRRGVPVRIHSPVGARCMNPGVEDAFVFNRVLKVGMGLDHPVRVR